MMTGLSPTHWGAELQGVAQRKDTTPLQVRGPESSSLTAGHSPFRENDAQVCAVDAFIPVEIDQKRVRPPLPEGSPQKREPSTWHSQDEREHQLHGVVHAGQTSPGTDLTEVEADMPDQHEGGTTSIGGKVVLEPHSFT